ncbi:MAG TPA: pitrilysin family protein [bacterium]|nr:pitrilysin family protein [bacterium]
MAETDTAVARIAAVSPQRHVLPNGMVVLLKEDHRNPVAAIQVWVRTGSATEGRLGGSGVSHFVEHMMFKGTARRAVGEIAKEIQQYGGEINAHTSFDSTVYTVNIDSRHYLRALDTLADCIMHPSFDPAEVERERSVILKEIAMNEDDPGRKIYNIFFNTAYAVNPYKDPVIGYEDIFKRLTRDDLSRYFAERYAPNNMVIVAVGDLDAAKAHERIRELFGTLERASLPAVYVPAEPAQLGARVRIEKADVNKAHLFVGFHTTDVKHEHKYALDVIAMILGEGRSSRLYRLLREKLSLVSTVSAWSYTPEMPGVFAVSATCESDRMDRARDEIVAQVYRLKREPVALDELEKVKQTIISEYYFSLDTVSGQASDIGYSEVSTANCDFSAEYVARIQKVTADDIIRVATTYFYDENLTVAGIVPRGFREGPAAAAAAVTAEPVITRTVLPNGLTLLVREDHALPTVSVRALMRGGVIVENENNNGISNLCAQLMPKGTKTRSGEEIARAVESAGGSIESYSANNSFGCSVDIVSDRTEMALDIVADVLSKPVFDENDVEREKKMVELSIRSLEDQPFQAAFTLFRKTMFKGHPYRFHSLGSVESVARITRGDIVAFHEAYVVPGNIVLAVFGDVTAERVRALVEARFGAMQPKQAVFPKAETPREKGVVRAEARHAGKQAIVVVGYRGVDIYNTDKYPFEILDAMFSGQSSRLFASIRDEKGLAYAVGSQIITGLDPGAFVLYVATAPGKADHVVELIAAEIARLKSGGVAQEELARAQSGLIGVRKLQLQTNSQLSLQSGLDELYKLGYDNYRNYYARVGAVTEGDIGRVVRTYFPDDDYVVTVLTPDTKKDK